MLAFTSEIVCGEKNGFTAFNHFYLAKKILHNWYKPPFPQCLRKIFFFYLQMFFSHPEEENGKLTVLFYFLCSPQHCTIGGIFTWSTIILWTIVSLSWVSPLRSFNMEMWIMGGLTLMSESLGGVRHSWQRFLSDGLLEGLFFFLVDQQVMFKDSEQ